MAAVCLQGAWPALGLAWSRRRLDSGRRQGEGQTQPGVGSAGGSAGPSAVLLDPRVSGAFATVILPL